MCELVQAISETLKQGPVTKESLEQILAVTKNFIPKLQDELCHEDWQPGRYMLYKDPKHGFVVMMLVWGCGDCTPIHAHGTWGVEAVIKNQVKVTTYSSCQINPCVRECLELSEGAVAYVLPPDEDVHVVAQSGELPAITVHIYGKELTENITFTPGVGYRTTPVTCKLVKTSLFDFSSWKSSVIHSLAGNSAL